MLMTMVTSEERELLMPAIGAVQAAVAPIKKDSKNPYFKSTYASLGAVLDAVVGPALEHGLVITQWPDGDGLTTEVFHEKSGQYMRATTQFSFKETGPQAHAGNITYMRRYSLIAIFMLATEDDDGETAEGRQETRRSHNSPVSSQERSSPAELPSAGSPNLGTVLNDLHACKSEKELEEVCSKYPDIWMKNEKIQEKIQSMIFKFQEE